MEHFISMYIDNEMSLEEKILFIMHIRGNKAYTDDAVSMLEQEKTLQAAVLQPVPEAAVPLLHARKHMHSLGIGLAACILLVVSFLLGTNFSWFNDPSLRFTTLMPATVEHRFVLFQQGSSQVEIAGSFTEWQKVPLTPTGSEGYWEITLEVPSGEHRYSFIIDESKRIPDPTVASKESDDFGSINSVLYVET